MTINQYIEENKNQFLEELFELLCIPSISTDKAYKKEIYDGAVAFKKALSKVCNKVTIYKTTGNPIVYGERFIDSNFPTILVFRMFSKI